MEQVNWNSQSFLREYHEQMARVKRGDRSAYDKIRQLRSKEFQNTVAIVNQGTYVTENGVRVTFRSVAPMQQDTHFYSREFRVKATHKGRTVVEVVNEDCLLTGVRLKEQGFNPVVLNMASRRNPGGGVMTGAGAQEETLFRRTNLFRSLYQFAPYASLYGVPMSHNQYPLDRNFGGIYTPNVTLFRKSEQEGYALMKEPVELSFISVAGMNRPELTQEGMIADYLIEPIKNKMRTILRIGLQHGHDAIVLGALGCGAFRNPPRHVARLFHEVIDEDELAGKYSLIVFAILDDHNAHKSHNPEGNFKPIAEEFEGMGRLTPDEQKALMMWKMGAGNSAKRFNGENPIPEKKTKATKDSWNIEPMPERNTVIPMDVTIPTKAMEIVKYGHIPDAMEDHWFMYCDEDTIHYYRSWTGLCIYVAKYTAEKGRYRITQLQVNRDPEQYGCTDDEHDIALFMALLTEEYGGDASEYWNKAF